MMDSLVQGDDLTRSKKIYLPNFGQNTFPQIVLLSCLLVLLTFIIFIYNDDWPSISLLFRVFFALMLILIICGGFALTIYLIFRRHATFLSVRGNKLILTQKNRLEASDLSSIDYFLIITQIWTDAERPFVSEPSVSGFHRKEFFIVDRKAQREKIYTYDAVHPLRKAWERTAKQLGQLTGKSVVFKYNVQDLDGKVMELDEYQKQQFKRKIKIFQSPYK
jgi:hypothetical protein